MTERNILDALVRGVITEGQAHEILNAMLDDPLCSEVEKRLGFANTEWTAYAQGASLEEVATWRRNGWPTKCTVCGNTIEVPCFGWLVVDHEGGPGLKHISCPKV